jgi:hypothetical protein
MSALGRKRTLGRALNALLLLLREALPIVIKERQVRSQARALGEAAEMILRRVTEHLKKQNWTAVALDLAIVIVGVFIGTQVSNWNQERIEKRETAQLLLELRPALQYFADFFKAAESYYATTRAYSDVAFAGWRGDPAVSDEQFVVAAYQASQIHVLNINGENWAGAFGGDRLRDVDNVEVRRALTDLMTFDYDNIDQPAIATPYREQVRQVIPVDIQDAIRARCGDTPVHGSLLVLRLPATCDLDLPQRRFASAAVDLRAHRELIGELRWHRAATENFLTNLAIMDGKTRKLREAIDQSAE